MVEYDVLPEDFILRFFPRNLSYTEDSYLDNFSTCEPYVKTPASPRKYIGSYIHSRITKVKNKLCSEFATEFDILSSRKVKVMSDEGTSVDTGKLTGKGELIQIGSEDGIFLNMMDDLESVESPERRDSDGSDPSYFSMDSVSSPEESQEVKITNQTCLTNAASQLVKSELRKIVSDSAIDAQDGAKADNGDLKQQRSSSEMLDVKLASLKIEVNGAQIGDQNSIKYLVDLNVPESPVYDEPEFNINKAELRKTSSLKTSKTPPGTPSRKKMVRFADAMGLDLECVRHVMDTDNPPRIPASAIADLKVGVEEDRRNVGSRYLDLCFQQPCALENFMTRVMTNKVSLENCLITDMSITGVVRVANIGYHKCVRVRYSVNNWITFYDVMASYVQNSCDGATDRFSFTIVSPSTLGPGTKISFAVSYTVNDRVYWDNNSSKNYDIVCYAKTTPSDLDSSWVHFM